MQEVIEKHTSITKVEEYNVIKPSFKLNDGTYTSGFLKYLKYPIGTKIIVTIEILGD